MDSFEAFTDAVVVASFADKGSEAPQQPPTDQERASIGTPGGGYCVVA